MWYDLLVLGILAFFLLRGAARGLLSQLASIAAIVVCLVFAESISAAFGPHVNLDPPLNNWVVMFGAYLVFSFIAFGLARVLTDWMEKAKLESFNSHLGAVFGLIKGIIVCLVMTFFLVTLSPAARHALKVSKTAYAAASLMDRVHPIMPREIQAALTQYLVLYETGEVAETPSEQQGVAQPGSSIPANSDGTPSPFPNWSPDAPFTPPSMPAPVAGPIDQFLSHLPATIGSDLKWLLARSLENTPPEQRLQAEQQLWAIVHQARAEDIRELQQQLMSNGRQTLSEAIAAWSRGFLAPSTPAAQPLASPPSYPGYTGSPSGFASPSSSGVPGGYGPAGHPSAISGTSPQTTPYRGPTYPGSSYPPQSFPGQSNTGAPVSAPPPLSTAQSSRLEQLLGEISQSFSSIPPVQKQVQADIRQRLTGLPDGVGQAVLEDWYRDLRNTQAADPDPGTDASTTLEVRVLRQLQRRQVPVHQLSREVQQRLEGASLR